MGSEDNRKRAKWQDYSGTNAGVAEKRLIFTPIKQGSQDFVAIENVAGENLGKLEKVKRPKPKRYKLNFRLIYGTPKKRKKK